jgi:actin
MKFELPDGNVCTLTDERCKVCEVLFKPSLVGKELSGIHKQV